MIKNIKILYENPGMIEVEFEPIDQNIIDSIYEDDNLEQMSFENLVVESGRFLVSQKIRESENYIKLETHFKGLHKTITQQLLDIDKVRWPIFYEFNTWWNNNNFDKYTDITVVLDKPGFSQPFHLDNRFAMWAGTINLDDNETTTIFGNAESNWIDKGLDKSERYYQASGKKWTGTFWLNTENNWHGVPLVNKDRRILIVNMLLAQ